MNQRSVLEVGIKLVGLYFAVAGVVALPTLMIQLAAGSEDHPMRFTYGALAQSLCMVFAGVILLALANRLARLLGPEDEPDGQSRIGFSACVQFLGLYLAALAAARVIEAVVEVGFVDRGRKFYFGEITGQSLLLVFGLLCILKGPAIASFIRRSGNEPESLQDDAASPRT